MKQGRPIHQAVRRLLACALGAGVVSVAPALAEQKVPPLKREAMQRYYWGDFEALQKMNDELRHGLHVDADGSSELEQLRDGIGWAVASNMKNEESYLREMESLTLQWATAHPASALAQGLHAHVLMRHAWSYRGGGYMKDVPPEAWGQFQKYLKRAGDYLNAHANVALADSYTHYLLLEIGRGLEWEPRQLEAIMQDGLKRNPLDTSLYFAMLTSLLPKWGGDPRALDDFIRRAAEQTRAEQGMAMYARLYSRAAEEEFGHKLFESSYADWDLVKQGYEDMLKRYPDTVVRLNRFAYMACLAKDRPTLLSLFARIGKRLETTHWGVNPERSLEGCQRWAKET